MKKISTQTFSRFEMKYIINESTSKLLKNEVSNFMIYDGFAIKEGKYFVRSLYFDNKIIIITLIVSYH